MDINRSDACADLYTVFEEVLRTLLKPLATKQRSTVKEKKKPTTRFKDGKVSAFFHDVIHWHFATLLKY